MKELTQRQREVLQFITEYINAHSYPPTIREIAEHFDVSVKGAYDHVTALKRKGLIRGDKRSRTIELVKSAGDVEANPIIEIPILGIVAAGRPIMATENWEGVVPINRSLLKKNGDFFAVRVRGDSMEGAGIMDGDTAIIEKQDTVNNGEIAVVMVDDEAMTLKRFYKETNRVRLQPENPKRQIIYSRNVRVLGRVIHVFRSYP
ncbi:MAG: transcriptional repressor LexA [Spirochaetaceae bacterium]|jgi:repressor LexA|nr:transcriptional repressor LexA [Spirochaetaceae bacterium]